MIETKGADLFVEDLKYLCKQHKIKLTFNRSRTVLIEGKIRSSGYFDSEGRELKIGKKRSDWLQLLVHESCHVDQWLEGAECWKWEDEMGNDIVDSWLLGKHYNYNKLRRAFRNVILLELDCEKRSIDKIIEYDLPINVHSYTQKANAYLFYHHTVLKTRTWNPEIYNKPSIINNMPARILSEDEYMTLPKKLEKYFF
jgi:hypothetical protein